MGMGVYEAGQQCLARGVDHIVIVEVDRQGLPLLQDM